MVSLATLLATYVLGHTGNRYENGKAELVTQSSILS